MRTTTTELDKLRKNSMPFTWGRVIRIHDIGEYSLVESEKATKDSVETTFHIYIDGKNSNVAESSLDRALIMAICTKYLGMSPACHLTHFIWNGIKDKGG